MTFRKAVGAVSALDGTARPGLQALNTKQVVAASSVTITGSIDLDSALAKIDQGCRWDYGIGFRCSNQRAEHVVWIEVHPAGSTHNVQEVVNKLKWLTNWLDVNAPHLRSMTQSNPRHKYVWVATGDVKALLPRSREARSIAQHGLHRTKYYQIG